eukprot:GHVU01023883.1.p2 GENE.GHVU01023883.1~~GHVU01023883.1.p2  ORF type:complete len:128 (+),score=35.71 GHVU01023883.1:166-549(+)
MASGRGRAIYCSISSCDANIATSVVSADGGGARRGGGGARGEREQGGGSCIRAKEDDHPPSGHSPADGEIECRPRFGEANSSLSRRRFVGGSERRPGATCSRWSIEEEEEQEGEEEGEKEKEEEEED